jgi:hypothetical protein
MEMTELIDRAYVEKYKDKIEYCGNKTRKLYSSKITHNRIKYSAKKRKKEFNITLEEYRAKYWDKNCYYCGDKSNGGIDRADNTKGYTEDNIVPCCSCCNRAKFKRTQQEFYSWIKRLIDKHKDRDTGSEN